MKLVKRLSMKVKTTNKPTLKDSRAASSPSLVSVDKSMDESNTTEKTSRSFGSLNDSTNNSSPTTISRSSSLAILPGSVVVGTVTKESQSSKVGISLKKDDDTNTILINSIAESGLFSATKLKVGQKVLSINGAPCPKDTVEAASLIAATTGILTIEAGEVVVEQQQQKDVDDFSMTDIVEVAESDNMSVYIDDDEDPLLGHLEDSASDNDDDQVNEIADVNTSGSSMAVVDGTVVVGKVEKATQSTKVGISLRNNDDDTNTILIYSIAVGGLFSATDLKVGQKVLTINGAPCPKEATEAARIISNTTGTLTIEAGDVNRAENELFIDESFSKDANSSDSPDDSSSLPQQLSVGRVSSAVIKGSSIVGTVEKPTPDTKVGISLRKDEDSDSIVIDSIVAGGLFSQTDLQVGQKVLTINGSTCPKEPTNAARLIGSTVGTLAIEAADVLRNDAGGDIQSEEEQTATQSLSPKDVDVSFLSEIDHVSESTETANTGMLLTMPQQDALLLDSNMVEAEARVAELESKIASLEGLNDTLSKSMTDLEKAAAAKEKSLQDNMTKLAEMKDRTAELDEKITELSGENKTLSSSKKALEDQVSIKTSKMARLESAIEQLSGEKEVLASQSKTATAEDDSDKNSLISELENLTAANEALAESKHYLQDAITGKVSKISELESTISGLTREKDALNAKIKTMEADAATETEKFSKMESAIVDLASQIATLKGANETLSNLMKGLESAVSDKDESLLDNMATIADLEAKCLAITEEKNSILKSKNALEAKLLEKDAKITKLQSVIDGLKRDKEEFETQALGGLAAVAAGAMLVGAGLTRAFSRP